MLVSVKNRFFYALAITAILMSSGVSLAADSDVGVSADASDSSAAAPDEVADATPGVPSDFNEASELVLKAVNLASMGKWLLLAIILVQLGVFLVRRYAPEGYMKRWGSVTVSAMAGAVAVLGGISGGLAWHEAVLVFLTGPGSSLVVDFLHATGLLKRKSENA